MAIDTLGSGVEHETSPEKWTVVDSLKKYQEQVKEEYPTITGMAPVWIFMLNRGNTIRESDGSELVALRDYDGPMTEDGLPDELVEIIDRLDHDGGLYVMAVQEERPTQEKIDAYIDETFK